MPRSSFEAIKGSSPLPATSVTLVISAMNSLRFPFKQFFIFYIFFYLQAFCSSIRPVCRQSHNGEGREHVYWMRVWSGQSERCFRISENWWTKNVNVALTASKAWNQTCFLLGNDHSEGEFTLKIKTWLKCFKIKAKVATNSWKVVWHCIRGLAEYHGYIFFLFCLKDQGVTDCLS